MALLRETQQPVTEICLDVGFTSLGSFSRTFTRVVGDVADGLPRGWRPARAPPATSHLRGHVLDAPRRQDRSFGEANGDGSA